MGILIGAVLLFIGYYYMSTTRTSKTPHPDAIRYFALGDSYTIGLDVDEADAWPSVLVNHLQSEGVEIELIENAAVSGFTAADVITYQLPRYERSNPQFVTLLVGANDVSLGIRIDEYRSNLTHILDNVLEKLKNKSNVILLTIPDFTNTPRGKEDFAEDNYRETLKEYNRVIKQEADKRNITVVDLENINDDINSDTSYYTYDGLHPSAKQYKLWEQLIYPKVKTMLDEK